MEAKRKPKGSEGGNLQIRDLDADTLEKLKKLQEYFRVGTNSKAVFLAIKNFFQLVSEIKSLRQQLSDALFTICEQKEILDRISYLMEDYQKK